MLDNELGWTNYQHRMVNRWQGREHSHEQDCVAEEVPIVLVYNGISHVVMLATPTNLEDFSRSQALAWECLPSSSA